MTAYLDASVLLRIALGQPDALPEWSSIRTGVASALVVTECLRTLDRLRLRVALPDREFGTRRATVLRLTATLHLVDIDPAVLDRAAQPMPTLIGTLDAIHLATALLWQDFAKTPLVFATHDAELALAAHAHGFQIAGATV